MANTNERTANGGKGNNIVFDELYPLIAEDLRKIKEIKGMQTRLGAMCDYLRQAVEQSSLGMLNGRPYVFNGMIYEPIRWEDYQNAVYTLMQKARMDYAELLKHMVVAYSSQGVIKARDLYIQGNIAVMRNGVLDINHLKLYPHDKRFVQTTMCDFDYDPLAMCDRWEKFLNEVIPDRMTQCVLQEFMGAIFIDRKKAKIENFLILKGAGSNGKGVIFETAMGIVGRENVTNFGLDSMLMGGDQKKNIAMMNGKKLNYCSEIQALTSGKFTDRLKAIISGEPMEARALYGENFMARDLPLLIANCNRLPKIDDPSYGLQRRLLIIEFTKVIPVELQDKLLSQRLVSQYSGIFNWILEGRARLMKRKYQFTHSSHIEQAVLDYCSATNSTIKFMRQKDYLPTFKQVKDMLPIRVKAATLYAEYSHWCAKYHEHQETMTFFGRDLAEAGYVKRRNSDGFFYDVYGQGAREMLEKNREDVELFYAGIASKRHKPLFVDGKFFSRGDECTAFYSHLNRAWLTTMRLSGKLDGCFKYEYGQPIYDVDKLIRRCDELGIYNGENKRTEYFTKIRQQGFDVENFNETMKALGEPFRKWCYGIAPHAGNDFIIVENEWEYSMEAAEELKAQNAINLLKKMK